MRLKADITPELWMKQLCDELQKLRESFKTIESLESAKSPKVNLWAFDDDGVLSALCVTLSNITFPDGMCVGYADNQLVNIHVSDDDEVIVILN